MGLGIFRNRKCYCGSGKKFKKCHLFIDMPNSVADLNEKMRMFFTKQVIAQQAKEITAKKEEGVQNAQESPAASPPPQP